MLTKKLGDQRFGDCGQVAGKSTIHEFGAERGRGMGMVRLENRITEDTGHVKKRSVLGKSLVRTNGCSRCGAGKASDGT